MNIALTFLPIVSLFPFFLNTHQESLTTGLLIILGIVIADNGHVFLTSLRLFHERRTREEKLKYLSVYLFFIVFTFSWLVLQIPYFWSFFLYLTAYHHTRQNIGMGSWIAKPNGSLKPLTRFILYWIFLAPLLLFHFRPDFQSIEMMPGVYQITKLGFGVTENIFNNLKIFYFLITVVLMLLHLIKIKPIILNFYILSVFVLNSVCFLLGVNIYEIYIPLIMSHGLTYYLVMIHTTKKIFSWKSYTPIFVVILFGIVAGLIDWNLQFEEMYQYSEINIQKIALLGISFSLSMNLSHYIIDGWIWKKTDSEYKQIFN